MFAALPNPSANNLVIIPWNPYPKVWVLEGLLMYLGVNQVTHLLTWLAYCSGKQSSLVCDVVSATDMCLFLSFFLYVCLRACVCASLSPARVNLNGQPV